MGRPPGTTVFVGNISYETTEEQLKEVFSQVGNVLSFRLMYDHDTGKAKGFGFCEYEDKETAMSARRNLNGTELNGRSLRVDLTENDKQAAKAQVAAAAAGVGVVPGHPALPKQLVGPNPSMARMTPREIHETMVALKRAIEQDANSIREMLLAKPALTHAILHGQIILGMVPPPPMPPPQGAAPPSLVPPPPPPHLAGPPAPVPPMMRTGPPVVAPPPQQPPQQMPVPPPMGAVPPQPGQQVPGPGLQLSEEQANLFKTVMSLTQEQIDQLAPGEREGVMIVRNQFAQQQQQQQRGPPPPMQGQPPSYR